VVFGIALLLAALVTYLIFGANPWIAGFFETVEAGQATTLADRVAAGGWFGAAINATICLLLLMTSAWWTVSSPLAARAANREASAVWGVSRTSRANDYRGGWWFWVLLIVAIGLAAALRYQRLNLEFSSQEQAAVSEMILGDGPALAWQQTLFGGDAAGVQPLARLSARVAHAAMAGNAEVAAPGHGAAPIRCGPFVAGIVAVLIVGLWLRATGAPLAGLAAAFLLAVHPWHLRWSSSVGGHSESLSWLLLAMVVASLALETGRWRWFLLGSFLQAMAILSFSAAAVAVAALVLWLAGTLLIRREGISFVRWLVATCIAGMLVIQILAPVFVGAVIGEGAPAISDVSASEQAGDGTNRIDLWSKASAGGPWSSTNDNAGDASAVVSVEDMDPAGSWIFGLALPLLAFGGLVGGVVRGRIKTALLLPAIVSVVFSAVISRSGGHSARTDSEWQALFLGLVFCLSLASLVEWLRRSGSALDRNRLISKGEGKWAWVLAILLVVLYTFVTWAPRSALL
jgi:hypothetical protein